MDRFDFLAHVVGDFMHLARDVCLERHHSVRAHFFELLIFLLNEVPQRDV